MHQLGAIGASGLGKELGEQTPIGRISSSPSNYTATTGLCQSRLLAEMVTDGMLNRAQQKKEAAGREADAAAGKEETSTRSFLPWLSVRKSARALFGRAKPSQDKAAQDNGDEEGERKAERQPVLDPQKQKQTRRGL